MAALSLKRIRQARFSDSLDVRIFVDYSDRSVLDDFEYVRDHYYPEAALYQADKHIEVPSGSWNILQSLKSGYAAGADRVFLVEEDVMVFPDYFVWNFSQSGDHFATCGRLRKEHSSTYYTNPGACFSRDSLALVVPHINNDYFDDQRGYLDAVFGDMSEASPLDDGLIRRVIRQVSGYVLYPETPKVAHQGFRFYNRLDRYKVEGSISQRIERASELLDRVSCQDRYSQDFEPFLPERRP